MNKEDINQILTEIKNKYSLEEGAFVLFQTSDLSVLNNLEIDIMSALLSELKYFKINPILCPHGDTKLIQDWIDNPFISGYLSLDGTFQVSKKTENLALKNTPYINSNYTGFFTSGSTGRQKIIIHKNSSLLLSARESIEQLVKSKDDLILSSLPLFHLGGFLQLIRRNECHANIEFCSPKSFINSWKSKRPKAIVGVPTQLISGLENNCPSVTFYSGGAKLMEHVWLEAIDNDHEIISTYGLTESAGAILFQKHPHQKEVTYPSCKILINDNSILSFSSKRIAHSILSFDRDYPEQIDPSNFYETKDLAIFQGKENQLRIKGRVDRLIICAGENIDPLEIQNLVISNYDFGSVILKGFEHSKLGQIPVLFIEPFPLFKSTQDQREWSLKFRSLFQANKRPRYIMSFPKLSGIKPSQEELHRHYLNRNSSNCFE